MPIPYELSEIDDIVDGDTVAIDLETYDPELKTHGSGAIKGIGKVCGIALAYRDQKRYYPIGHKGDKSGKNRTWKKLNDRIFQNEKIVKVFHNAMYDVCWIRTATGMMLKGPIYDTMIAASIIDENRPRYTLDSLGKDYLGETKYKYDLAERSKEESIGSIKQSMKILRLGNTLKTITHSEIFQEN